MKQLEVIVSVEVGRVNKAQSGLVEQTVNRIYPQLLGIHHYFEQYLSMTGPLKLLVSMDNHRAMRLVIGNLVWQALGEYVPVKISTREVMEPVAAIAELLEYDYLTGAKNVYPMIR
jgi:hypothetical protein